MKRLLIASALVAALVACKKDKDDPPSSGQPLVLLTDGEWLLTAYGFDDDSSAAIEPAENMITPCQLDNTIRYYTNGTGMSFENAEMCVADSSSSFEWKFIDDERAIEVVGVRMDLKRLTGDELHLLLHEPALKDPLLIIYRKLR